MWDSTTLPQYKKLTGTKRGANPTTTWEENLAALIPCKIIDRLNLNLCALIVYKKIYKQISEKIHTVQKYRRINTKDNTQRDNN
jgi:hypothetical protein